MQEINSFKKGLKDGIPICIGYFSVAFAFGIFAVENGLTIIQSVLVSLINQTSYSLKLIQLLIQKIEMKNAVLECDAVYRYCEQAKTSYSLKLLNLYP